MNNRFLGTLSLATICTLAWLPLASAQTGEAPRGFRMHQQGEGDGAAFQRGGRGPDAAFARHRRQGMGPRPGRLDTDDDGQISEEEFLAGHLANVDRIFERLDTNEDGLISLEESSARARPHGQGRPNRPEVDLEALRACVLDSNDDFEPPQGMDLEDRFDSADTNGDGQLSLDELTTALGENALQRFDRIDSDGDGFLTREELLARAEAQRERTRQVRACLREQA